MSWDVFVQDMPDGIHSVQDIPDDFSPGPLGTYDELVERICSVAAEVDFDEQSGWGVLNASDYSIEIHVAQDRGLVSSVGLFVRGGDAAASATVAALVSALGGKAVDTAADDGLFSPDRALESFARWKAWRDQAVRPTD